MIGHAATEPDLEILEPPPFDSSIVVELLRAFAKAVRAHQLYLPNNPMHTRAIDAAKSAFLGVWQEDDSLTLRAGGLVVRSAPQQAGCASAASRAGRHVPCSCPP